MSNFYVSVEVALLRGSVRAEGTGEGLLPGVSPQVAGQFGRVDEVFITVWTFEGVHSRTRRLRTLWVK